MKKFIFAIITTLGLLGSAFAADTTVFAGNASGSAAYGLRVDSMPGANGISYGVGFVGIDKIAGTTTRTEYNAATNPFTGQPWGNQKVSYDADAPAQALFAVGTVHHGNFRFDAGLALTHIGGNAEEVQPGVVIGAHYMVSSVSVGFMLVPTEARKDTDAFRSKVHTPLVYVGYKF